MTWKSKLPVAGALSAVVIGGVAIAAPSASAATDVADSVGGTIQQVTDGLRHGRHHHGMRGQAVADELGIDVEVYRDAVKAVLQARIDAGEERPVWGDMTPEERLAFRAGWTADVAAELGISASELQAAHDAVFQARLDEAVANGRLTQAEAGEMLQAYQDGTLFDLLKDRRVDTLGGRIDQLLENGIITDDQYAALQAELDDEDLQGFRELIHQYREDNGFDGPRLRGFRGLDGAGPVGQDVAVEGISL